MSACCCLEWLWRRVGGAADMACRNCGTCRNCRPVAVPLDTGSKCVFQLRSRSTECLFKLCCLSWQGDLLWCRSISHSDSHYCYQPWRGGHMINFLLLSFSYTESLKVQGPQPAMTCMWLAAFPSWFVCVRACVSVFLHIYLLSLFCFFSLTASNFHNTKLHECFYY